MRTDPSSIKMLASYKQTPVTEEQGKEVAGRVGAKMYVECSALKQEGVGMVFEHATRAALLPKIFKKKERKCRTC